MSELTTTASAAWSRPATVFDQRLRAAGALSVNAKDALVKLPLESRAITLPRMRTFLVAMSIFMLEFARTNLTTTGRPAWP